MKNIKIRKKKIKLTPILKKNDRIESKLQEQVRNRLLSQNKLFKVTKAVIFIIDNHENEIVSVVYEDKKIQTKDKWNQLNIMDKNIC